LGGHSFRPSLAAFHEGIPHLGPVYHDSLDARIGQKLAAAMSGSRAQAGAQVGAPRAAAFGSRTSRLTLPNSPKNGIGSGRLTQVKQRAPVAKAVAGKANAH